MENDQNSNEMPQGNGTVQDGSDVSGVEATPVPPQAPEAVEEKTEKAPEAPAAGASSAHADERRGMAAIGYVGILCLIPLIFAKDSVFAQYHAKQGLVLAIAGVALNFLSGWLWRVPMGSLLVTLIGLAIFVASIMGIMKALNGEKFDIPYVSEWAEKLHF